MGSLAISKQTLRNKFKDLRNGLSGDIKKQLDHKICERASELIKKHSNENASVWTTYMPFRNEVDPTEVLEMTPSHIRWAFPVVQNETMKFFIPNSAKAFRLSGLGIQEPDPKQSRELGSQEITGCLVPGLAFDRKGARLGYGKGHYDRFLQTFNGCSIALAYGLQINEDGLPCESTDVLVQNIVTENEVITRA